MEYGLIGERLGHSFSAEIHPLLHPASYVLREVAKEELDAFLTKRDFQGINVTIPYKQAVLPYLAYTEPQAERIGAVNTVLCREGKLYGYNTDFYGMCRLFSHLGVSPKGKKVAILGTGGTSLTAMEVARELGAGEILRVSRSERADAITYETLIKDHRDTQVIINTTPCGMYPHSEDTPLDLSPFHELACVVDAIYNPLRTRLVLQARERGIPAEGGLFMLVAQAVRASELFHDCTYAEDICERIWRQLERRKENVVLIGMPGSGKTTVGELLSKRLGRPFVDTDRAFTEQIGKTPAEVIEQEGEAVFRDRETQVLRRVLDGLNGAVIATGGGIILREENITLLRQNGRICFLDRPWQSLIPTSDRPLSGTAELLEKRYNERYSRYCRAADLHLSDPASAEDAAQTVAKEFEL